MPTKKKRVGFIPREEVMKIIDKLSLENNLSNSKIISILVEEALSVRGIFNNKSGKAKHLYQEIKEISQGLPQDPVDFNRNEKFTINTKLGNHINPDKIHLLKQTNHDSFDLQTYEKFLSFLKFQEMMDLYNN